MATPPPPPPPEEQPGTAQDAGESTLNLWEVQAELRGAQLMLEAAQRNRQEAQNMLLQDGSPVEGSWADAFVRSQAEQEEALRQQQQQLQQEIWQADLELQAIESRKRSAQEALQEAARAQQAEAHRWVCLVSDAVIRWQQHVARRVRRVRAHGPAPRQTPEHRAPGPPSDV